MKKINRLALGLISCFLTFATIPTISMENVRNEKEKIEYISIGIQQVCEQIRLAAQDNTDAEESVILIGYKGAGKSTLINHLAGKRLMVEKRAGTYKITPQDPLKNINIVHGQSAGTKIPGAWYDEPNKVVYWDCPGFCDPRGEENEIINAFAIRELFLLYPKTKIVIAMAESTITEMRGENFLKILSKLTKTFPNQESLVNSLSFLITKQRDFDLPDFQELWENSQYINDTEEHRDVNVRRIFQFLAYNAPVFGL